MKRQASLAIALVFWSTALYAQTLAPGQEPKDAPRPSDILTDRPDADHGALGGVGAASDLLGPVFESKGHGIALRPPKDTVAVRRVGAQDIIEFNDEKKGWTLKVSKIMLPDKGSLTEWRTPQGEPQQGVLEFTATRLKEEIPDAQFLRQEKINIGDGDVGILVLRYTRNLKDLLTQQAIIQRTDQMYYLLALTTPGARKGSNENVAAPIERQAVETFRQVLDSVQMLDLAGVREDQNMRLYSTRTWFVNVKPEKIKKALQRQSWTRILKNGKDVGYTYVEESDQERGPDGTMRPLLRGGQEGIEVRYRSRMRPGNDVQLDVGSMLYVTMDMRHEDWSTLVERASLKMRTGQTQPTKAPQTSETGISDRKSIPGRGDDYTLQVLFEGNAERNDPLSRELPPFYLPQAISHMLPRLLPLNEAKTYMFMTYVSDAREVMMRYVDVLEVQKVTFNGKVSRAVPVKDRLGLEGPVTTHYLTQDGKWLGSESKDTGLTIIPSNEETLLSIWKDANLQLPDAPKREEAKAAADENSADAPAAPKAQPARKSTAAKDSGNSGRPPKKKLGLDTKRP